MIIKNSYVGGAVEFNEVNQQDKNIMLIKLSEGCKKLEKMSELIFGIEYIKGKNSVFIDTGKFLFINLSTDQLANVKLTLNFHMIVIFSHVVKINYGSLIDTIKLSR
ncbi:hypothetical protein [Pantoea coffeiphila]|uniref:hypothetical protein n=1 Tax=Pantoea coffeiphila TaxID=1465635 RepID=UPI001960DCE2|nr:hypothetical protein [Pantoea coffeiphila]MBM7344032.1 hypothetical protein [Pantoea coffeiphila]